MNPIKSEGKLLNTVMQGDCLELMKDIPDGSIDAIITDPPYGTTACKWDSVIPFEPMWAELKRIIKPNGAIVLTARQPFTSALVMSNPKMFRQSWVWDKVIGVNFMNAKKMHVQGFEDVLIFYSKSPTFNPQMEAGKPYKDNRKTEYRTKTEAIGSRAKYVVQDNSGERYPRGIVKFSSRDNKPLHPTQKPVALMEYLIKTYTHEGETVLDFTMGSGSTGVACVNTNRNFIGIELDEKYFEIAKARIEEEQL